MGKEVIFKTFRTYAHPYLYDRHTNSLVMLSSDDEFAELRDVETGKLPWEQSAVVHKYQSFGLMQPNVVEKIEHPATQIVEQYLATRMHQLILQVTQQCNLRCAYCAYSGIYSGNRTHSNLRMSWETAKKAIDFFLQRTLSLSEIVISFYGGEPLLEFELIEKCVEYVNSQVEGKKVSFNMTTNGTLLTGEIVDYLVEHDFHLAISLDGSEQEHDANRKFANGKGSFAVIIDNIRRIKLRYPEYDKKIQIMTTINPRSDLGCVLEYFSTDEVLEDKFIVFNPMKETLLEEKAEYGSSYYMIRNYEYMKRLFSMVNKLDRKYVSQLTRDLYDKEKRLYDQLKKHAAVAMAMHHNGPCMAGVQRLFVRADGILYPCERVNENVDFFKIGNLDDGIDLDKVRALMNIGKVTEENCKNCWNLSHCSLCSKEIEFTGELTKEAKLQNCKQNCNSALLNIYELCVLMEFGFVPEEERINNEESCVFSVS